MLRLVEVGDEAELQEVREKPAQTQEVQPLTKLWWLGQLWKLWQLCAGHSLRAELGSGDGSDIIQEINIIKLRNQNPRKMRTYEPTLSECG